MCMLTHPRGRARAGLLLEPKAYWGIMWLVVIEEVVVVASL